MSKPANQPTTIADIAAILAQYEELKQRDPEAILLFRVEDEQLGSGYRVFGEDAQVVYEAVGTKGMRDLTFIMTKTGIILSAADLETVLARIVKAGKRAAVCERVQGPAPTGAKAERVVTEGKFVGKWKPVAVPRSNADVIKDARALIWSIRKARTIRIHPLDVDLINELADRLEGAEKIANDLVTALERMLEESPFVSYTDACECGENGDGFDDNGNPCEHIEARRAIAQAKGHA